jgi:hypothetical protein
MLATVPQRVLLDPIDEVFAAAFDSGGGRTDDRVRPSTARMEGPFTPTTERIRKMTYTKERVADAAASARPYVERALRDQELRENIRNAYTSARAVYAELSSRRRISDAATQLASDQDVQSELRNAIEELRNAASRVQGVQRGAPEPARAARNGTILLLGICLGILLNPITGPAVRRALSRKLFGTGNGFVYQGNGSAAKAE